MGSGGGVKVPTFKDITDNPMSLFRPMDEAVGELSGRNLQRKAQFEAKDALAEEQRLAAKARKDELIRMQAQDIAASAFVGSQRNSSMF